MRHVFIHETPTNKLIEIIEPGAQQVNRSIRCTLAEAEDLMEELASALHLTGYYRGRKDPPISDESIS